MNWYLRRPGSTVARNRCLASISAISFLLSFVSAQFGNTFAYTGDDALRSMANVNVVHYGGFANSLALHQGEQVVYPFLPALFYELGYLVKPANEKANISLSVVPEVFLNVLFMGRVTGMADLVLLGEAHNRPGNGFGLRVGLGYSALGSTFDLTEHSPIVRAGFLIDNIRVTYAYSFGREVIVDHQIGIGLKFDF